MDKDHELKEMITQKLKNFLKLNIEGKKNEKYLLKDFSEIKTKPLSSNVILFSHPMFKDVKL